jgi:hypothetical protein
MVYVAYGRSKIGGALGGGGQLWICWYGLWCMWPMVDPKLVELWVKVDNFEFVGMAYMAVTLVPKQSIDRILCDYGLIWSHKIL